MKTDWGAEFPNSEMSTDPVMFWTYILNFENALGKKCYQELATTVLKSYCIPLSTAFVERVFFHISNVETKARNRLSTSSLESILRIRTHLHDKEIRCRNFKVTENASTIHKPMYHSTEKKATSGTMQVDEHAASTSETSDEGDSYL